MIHGKSATRRIRSYNDLDRSMEKIWLFKHPVIIDTNNRVKRRDIKWMAPSQDWVKLNFDGASKGNLREVGFGAIIRSNYSKIIHGVYSGMDKATNNEAKIRPLEAGLNLCIQNGISKVLIEGDSQIIINDIIKSKFECWKLCKWFPRINHLLELIGTFEIKHVYREGNRLADYLANLGVVCKDNKITFDQHSASNDIINHIKMDASHDGIG
ncbi:hypothetical protein SUGI_0323980 [Cryptomeria japonica]|nr:hypothetical protein SUGI_0323980 [Cryptomeria japonica]